MLSSLSHRNYIAGTMWSNKRKAGTLNLIACFLTFCISLDHGRRKVVLETGIHYLNCWNMNKLLPSNNDRLGSVRWRVQTSTLLKSVIITQFLLHAWIQKIFFTFYFPLKMAVKIDGGCSQKYGLIFCKADEIANGSCTVQDIFGS